MSDYIAKDPRCHVCYDRGCEHCPAVPAPVCLVCGEPLNESEVFLGTIMCSEHRRVRRLIMAYSGVL